MNMTARARQRAQIQRIGRELMYQLPAELFTATLDYLNFDDIMWLCEDPEFPSGLLQRKHLLDHYGSSILGDVVSNDWKFHSAIRNFIHILGEWDVKTRRHNLRPLLATIDSYGRYELCETFLEEDYFMGMREETLGKYIDIGASETKNELAKTPLEPLHAAVLAMKKEIVELLLKHGANPNSRAGVLGTALHFAKDDKVAKLLLAHGADINAKDALGYTPLSNAILKDKPDLVKLLVESGADVELLYDGNLSALDLAIKYSRYNTNIVRTLADAKCYINGPPGVVPPLHRAVENNEEDIIPILIEAGADLAVRYEGRTVLHVVQSPCIASRLLAYGADVNAKDKNGSTPFMLATERGIDLMDVYLMAGAAVCTTHLREKKILFQLVSAGQYHILKSLMSQCDLKPAIYGVENLLEGQSLLDFAMSCGFEGIADLLVETFPHLVISEDGENEDHILWTAAKHSSRRMLQRIIDLRKKVEVKDVDFQDGLVVALDRGQADIVEIFLQALIDPSNLGHGVHVPLFVLTAGTNLALCDMAMYLPEDPSKWIPDCERYYLSMETCHDNIEINMKMLRILLDHGADVSRAEYEGIGILHCAAWRNSEPLMRALLEAGADPLFKDENGYTPADWAAKMSHFQIEKILRQAEEEALAKQPKEEGQSAGVKGQL
ncbi:ankyrin repeat-rich membrane-spanning protein, putative [Talaromyces stipitatus ATCC 10500]|uniref:Ankyrin repeat-rich membrane-spanning protein, putative n=1 Tax=Talaromyces stipitatus (strain ATCC 10500 / CBS 375.48 / QM 6759 / NRRL 1006) TaxID=441959 RepID=B8MF79_TALSN|nr:ankyrin repeat-rich membrane-spanning protein, putative [Talaromyces stipitatus ATCC 10500]EED16178.1 ankyrin repeat-rich membrane-spanning protein, putative [Talaromyces stipitatus ATCC 10500]